MTGSTSNSRKSDTRRIILRNMVGSLALEIWIALLLFQYSNHYHVVVSGSSSSSSSLSRVSMNHALSVGIRSAMAPYTKSYRTHFKKSTRTTTTTTTTATTTYTKNTNELSNYMARNSITNDIEEDEKCYSPIQDAGNECHRIRNKHIPGNSKNRNRRRRIITNDEDDGHLVMNCLSSNTCSSVSSPLTPTNNGSGNTQQTSTATTIESMNQNNPTSHPTQVQSSRGGGVAIAGQRKLVFWENMVCGAISRSVAQILTHPANTMKTMLQSNRNGATKMTLSTLARPENMKMLTRGAGAQFVMSVPHGAINFAVLEYVRKSFNSLVAQSAWAREKQRTSKAFNPSMDFISSAISTVCCSIVSTPQMMILDNIMAGAYPNLVTAVSGLSKERGIMGFYSGWWPGLAGKIPSYALTWTLFQEVKEAQLRIFNRQPTDIENSIMGCMASTVSVCIMIPMDTIKTRLVTQMNYPDLVPYKGIIDCAVRVAKEEGIGTFYRGLAPRLISVVPMIGIQFGVYEFMKKTMVSRQIDGVGGGDASKNNSCKSSQASKKRKWFRLSNEDRHTMEEVMMEVAADDDQPFPVPHFDGRNENDDEKTKRWWSLARK